MLRKELKRFSGDAFPKIGRKVGRQAATTQRPISIMLQYISAVRCPVERLAIKDGLVLRYVVLAHQCHRISLRNLAVSLEISEIDDRFRMYLSSAEHKLLVWLCQQQLPCVHPAQYEDTSSNDNLETYTAPSKKIPQTWSL